MCGAGSSISAFLLMTLTTMELITGFGRSTYLDLSVGRLWLVANKWSVGNACNSKMGSGKEEIAVGTMVMSR